MEFNLLIFWITTIGFVFVGSYNFWQVKSPFDFFHTPHAGTTKNLLYLIVSLTAANVSLGTGFAYYFDGVYRNGILFILIPLSVLLGYIWLDAFLKGLPAEISQGKNIIDSLNDRISLDLGKPSYFKNVLSYTLVTVFCLILSFEIFASSSIISSVIYNDADVFNQIKISIIIISTVLIYTTLGGIKGVVRSDIFQLIFLLIAIVGLILFLMRQESTTIQLSLQSIIKLNDINIWIAVTTSAVLAIATQFYSLINLGIITHLDQSNRSKLLIWGGLSSTIVFLLIFIVAMLNNVDSNVQPLMSFLNSISANKSKVLSCLLIVGFLSIVFSTIDTVIITLGMFTHDNIENKNSKSKEVIKNEINRIRVKILAFFTVTLFFLGFFNFFRPNLYYLLLGLGSPIAILAPMIYTAGKLAKKNDLIKLDNKHCINYFILFIFSHVCYFTGIVCGNQIIPNFIGLISIGISIFYSIWIFYRSPKAAVQHE
jgi:Na+/proline symporter